MEVVLIERLDIDVFRSDRQRHGKKGYDKAAFEIHHHLLRER